MALQITHEQLPSREVLRLLISQSLQTIADQLAVAIENARLLAELAQAQRELARIQALGAAASTLVAAIRRLRAELDRLALPQNQTEALHQDLVLIEANAQSIAAITQGST